MADLPEEIVMEILSWFPLGQVEKSKILSKPYAKATWEAYYRNLNAERQGGPVLDGFLLQTYQKIHRYLSFVSPRPPPFSSPFHLSLSFLPGTDPEILAVAPNGLAICKTRHPGRRYFAPIYCICKPTTKQWKGMPLPKTRYSTTGIAIRIVSLDPLRFKVVRFSKNHIPSKQPMTKSYLVCELFDSHTWRWRRLHDVVFPSYSGYIVYGSPNVSACGSAHWLLGDQTILAFDFDVETWSFIAPPDHFSLQDCSGHHHRVTLAQYEGKLALMMQETKVKATEVWVMEKYEKRIWTKRLDLAMEMPIAFYSSDVAMNVQMFTEAKFCNFVHGGCTYSPTRGAMYGCPDVFPFLSDFEPCNLFDTAPPRRLNPRTMLKILRKRLLAIQNNVHLLLSFFFFLHMDAIFLLTFLRTIVIASTYSSNSE
ncbi:F-box protein At5g49610-like [Momordica charantia]|uniref:F-box protein At5g49610-like n=1 Tax=Momordica charantia TaxID=3673 RepID=A0A6J1DPD6_MOMCH|nr:F-box protein At5g49610-like [Momordica charantia]